MKHALAGLLLVAGLAGAAQAQQTGGAPVPNISGLWNRLDTVGGDSYEGIDDTFPKAQLLPAAQAKLPPPQPRGADAPPPVRLPNGAYLTPAAAAAGGPSATAGRCNIGGNFGGGIDINSAGMAIIQSRDEVVVARDGNAGGRRIYLGRTMPDVSRIIPSGSGYSVGRWENGALVVTTTGFAPGMVAFGRGWKERGTVLTEVFRPSADGKRLAINYTWNDSAVYAKPHTYEMTFERWNEGYVFETYCDASIDHPENYTSVILAPGAADAGKK